MSTAAVKRSLDQRVKAVMAEKRRAAAAKTAAEKRARVGQKKVQAWVSAADAQALKVRAATEGTTIQALVGSAVRALLYARGVDPG